MHKPTDYPNDWTTQSLGAIASRLTSGGTPKSGDPRYYVSEGIPFAKIQDLTEAEGRTVEATNLSISETAVSETSVKVFPPGSILITMYGTMGMVKTIDKRMATNQAIAALVPPFDCDPAYLVHILDFSRERLLRLAGQTTQANLSLTKLKAFHIPRPARQSEQRRIAEVLDSVDAAIQETDAVIAKQEQVKTGLLQDLLTRGLDTDGRLRDLERHPEQFKDSPLGRIPKAWAMKPLRELAEIGSGLTLNRRKTKQNAIELPYLCVQS